MALPTNITARVVPTFPSGVTGQTGIDVTKQNGQYLIGLDLDDFGSARGSILYRNATAYTSLPPGTAEQVLTTKGASADPVWQTITLPDGSVTLAKIQDIATDTLLGRDATGSGSVEEISLSGGLEFDGSQGLQRSALTGDVTATAGSNATTIADEAVTLAKMQHIATAKLLGRGTAGTGDVEEITLGTNLSFTGTTLNAAGGGGAGIDPLFAATATGKTLTVNTWTKIPVDTELIDSDGDYDPTTNYRFTPSEAGDYLVFGCGELGVASGSFVGIAIYKNGSEIANAGQIGGATSAFGQSVVAAVNMNGTTDYLELFGYASRSTGAGATATKVSFSAVKLGA